VSIFSFGGYLPPSVTRLAGPDLFPVVHHVIGADLSDLRDIAELDAPTAYLAFYPDGEAYVGSSRHGNRRVTASNHLSYDALPTDVFVVTAPQGDFTEADAQALERFFFRKLVDLGQYKMRCILPNGADVGARRLARLELMGAQAMLLMQQAGRFAGIPYAELTAAPQQTGGATGDHGSGAIPPGRQVELISHVIFAQGIDLGDEGFVILMPSQFRDTVVPSLNAAFRIRRHELFYHGLLVRHTDGHFVLCRNLWVSSATYAAKLVTGSSASRSDWQWVTAKPTRGRPSLHLHKH
jgi:hypothetical protein